MERKKTDSTSKISFNQQSIYKKALWTIWNMGRNKNTRTFIKKGSKKMQIENAEQLRIHLLEEICKIRLGEISADKANATANVTRQILHLVRLELDTAKAQGRVPEIKFIYNPT